MAEQGLSAPLDTPSHFLLIVTGAHLRAEAADRPLAYQLCRRIETWFGQHDQLTTLVFVPLVCSDIWYLNNEDLHGHPTISLGGPGVNALSAAWAQRVPFALLRENQMVIQLDPEFVDLRASVWGMNHDLTVEAVQMFKSKYLDEFLRAVATQVEPEIG